MVFGIILFLRMTPLQGTASLYLNGNLEDSHTATEVLRDIDGLNLGVNAFNDGTVNQRDGYEGQIDEFSLTKTAVSIDDIRTAKVIGTEIVDTAGCSPCTILNSTHSYAEGDELVVRVSYDKAISVTGDASIAIGDDNAIYDAANSSTTELFFSKTITAADATAYPMAGAIPLVK